MRGLVIALHDVAPSTLPQVVRWRDLVEEMTSGPVSLLVVPRYGGRESWRSGPGPRWMRDRVGAGDEAVLHGWSHLSPGGRDGRELAGRDRRAIVSLIAEGVGELHEAGLAVDGFIAPSYVHPRAAHDSCRSLGMGWWATRLTLHSGAGARRLPSLGLGASTATRRAWSPAAARAAVAALSRSPVVRLDLHPADLRHARLERAARDLLGRLLAQGREPVAHGDLTPAR